MIVSIVDYGMGNIKSVKSTLQYLGVQEVVLTADFDLLEQSDKIILPGVGSFAKAMQRIKATGLDKTLNELCVIRKKPLLGICLGMQLLGLHSPEDGGSEGLGFINATVTRFDDSKLAVPHVGFNQVIPESHSKLYRGISGTPDFYFTHSYKMMSESAIHQSMCSYGEDFVASFEKENIAGTQFHPELSQANGLKLLKNFIDLF